jgi:hypothetical protein
MDFFHMLREWILTLSSTDPLMRPQPPAKEPRSYNVPKRTVRGHTHASYCSRSCDRVVSPVVEVYAKWCGPSQACMTTYRMFRDEFIEQKRRLRLYRVCATQLAPELPAEFDALKHDARPTFWLMLNGEKLGTVAGVNMPTLEKLVTALIPDGFLEDEEAEEATDNVQDE